MKIACDLDGVAYEWHTAVVYMLNNYRGYHLDWRDWTDWNWIERVVTPEDWEWLWTDAIDLGLYRYGHVIKGAIIGIQELQRNGHEVVFVTHRPKSAVQDTLDWLSYVRLRPSGVHILTAEEAKTSVPADLYIDDKKENIQDVAVNSSKKIIAFDQPWNKGPLAGESEGEGTRFRRAYGWEDVVKAVEEMS
jgi:5'(3')-deoxyribonucleotidase